MSDFPSRGVHPCASGPILSPVAEDLDLVEVVTDEEEAATSPPPAPEPTPRNLPAFFRALATMASNEASRLEAQALQLSRTVEQMEKKVRDLRTICDQANAMAVSIPKVWDLEKASRPAEGGA